MDNDKKEIWKVKERSNSRIVKGVVQYQVWWRGCTELEDTWETFDHLNNCLKKLHEFQLKFLRKSQDERDV